MLGRSFCILYFLFVLGDALSNEAADHWKQGLDSFYAGKLQSALSAFESFVNIEKTNAVGYVLLSEVYESMGDSHAALKFSQIAYRLAPSNAVALSKYSFSALRAKGIVPMWLRRQLNHIDIAQVVSDCTSGSARWAALQNSRTEEKIRTFATVNINKEKCKMYDEEKSTLEERMMQLSDKNKVGFLLNLIQQHDIDQFIETGTYKGQMAEAIGPYVKEFHSIEIDKGLHEAARAKWKNTNTKFYLGDSAAVLADILALGVHSTTLFWLDAHWCGGDAFGSTETPIVKEISSILLSNRSKPSIVVIDDARYFNGFDGGCGLEYLENNGFSSALVHLMNGVCVENNRFRQRSCYPSLVDLQQMVCAHDDKLTIQVWKGLLWFLLPPS